VQPARALGRVTLAFFNLYFPTIARIGGRPKGPQRGSHYRLPCASLRTSEARDARMSWEERSRIMTIRKSLYLSVAAVAVAAFLAAAPARLDAQQSPVSIG